MFYVCEVYNNVERFVEHYVVEASNVEYAKKELKARLDEDENGSDVFDVLNIKKA